MPETHFREVGADPCLTLCSITSSFNSIKAAAAVLSLLCHGFCLMMLQMFSTGKWPEMHEGQFTTWTLPLPSHAFVIDTVCSLTWSPLKKISFGWDHMFL